MQVSLAVTRDVNRDGCEKESNHKQVHILLKGISPEGRHDRMANLEGSYKFSIKKNGSGLE